MTDNADENGRIDTRTDDDADTDADDVAGPQPQDDRDADRTDGGAATTASSPADPTATGPSAGSGPRAGSPGIARDAPASAGDAGAGADADRPTPTIDGATYGDAALDAFDELAAGGENPTETVRTTITLPRWKRDRLKTRADTSISGAAELGADILLTVEKPQYAAQIAIKDKRRELERERERHLAAAARAEERIERTERHADRVDDRAAERQERADAALAELAEMIRDGAHLDPTAPVVENAAGELGIAPDDVIDRLRERFPDAPDAVFKPWSECTLAERDASDRWAGGE